MEIARCEIRPDGEIVLIFVGKSQSVGDDANPNPWDEVINADPKRTP
jgi:hypothetical protein